MTTRSLFNIILKILGIFFLKDTLTTIAQLIPVIPYLTMRNTVEEGMLTFASTVLLLLVNGIISYFLIFKSGLIIDKLKLDTGFNQETIPLNIHRSSILSVSIIVIGGLILVEEIPNLCRQLFTYFQEKRLTHGQTNPKISYSVLAASKVTIGLLLIGNQRRIVNFIEHSRRK